MSPPRRPSPVRKIRLKITVDADEGTIEGLRSLEGVVTEGGKASLAVTTDAPEEALAEIKRLAEALARKPAGPRAQENQV
jgi:hypothetical protein